MHRTTIQILFLCLIIISTGTLNAQEWQNQKAAFPKEIFVAFLDKDSNRLILAGEDKIQVKDENDTAFKNASCTLKTGGLSTNCKLIPYMIADYRNRNELVLLSDRQLFSSSNGGYLWNESNLAEFVSDWKKANFTKRAEKNNDIFFSKLSITNDYIYLIGMKFTGLNPKKAYSSVVFRSRDLQNWEDVKATFSNAAAKLVSLSFVNEMNAWAVGREGVVMQTIDGGKNWTQQNSTLLPTDKITLNDVYFTDIKNGWAVGDGGTIIATQDGGKTWKKQATTSRANLRKVKFINGKVGWIVGYKGTILFTENGGKNWEEQSQGTNNLNNIYAVELFPDDSSLREYHKTVEWVAYIVGDENTLIKGCSSAITCELNDIPQIEKSLSKTAYDVRKRDIELQKLSNKEKIENSKQRVKTLKQQLKNIPHLKHIDVDYIEDLDENREEVKLSGKVDSEDAKTQAFELARSITGLKVDIEDIKVKSQPVVVITDKFPDVGEFNYKNLGQQPQQLKCNDLSVEYSLDRIGIKKLTQTSFKFGNFTARAKLIRKLYAAGCPQSFGNQYFLPTQNGVYFSKKELLPGSIKWELMTPILDEDLLIRNDSIAITQSKVVILVSIYDNRKFVRNEIYGFDKSDLDKMEFKKVPPNTDIEYTKITYAGGTRLEISSNQGSKMYSIDNGNNWRDLK